jgi:N-acetylglucosaminyl-diphospho-decaprenol L-rhamnosyltransferase
VGEFWAVVVDYGHTIEEQLVDALIAARAERVVIVDNVPGPPRVVLEERGGALVEWRCEGTNLGYAGAINRVLARTSAPWLLVANPDVLVEPAAVARLLASAQRYASSAALVAPHLREVTGELADSVREFPSLVTSALHGLLGVLWPSNPASRRYHLAGVRPSVPYEAPWASGAFLLANVAALRALGGLDASFRLYLEDVDLAWRAWRAGRGVVVDPGVEVVHRGGGTTTRVALQASLLHARSLLRYALGQEASLAGALAVVMGVGVRTGIVLMRAALGAQRRDAASLS